MEQSFCRFPTVLCSHSSRPNPRNQGTLGAMLASRLCVIPSRAKRLPEASSAATGDTSQKLHQRFFSNPPSRRRRRTRTSRVTAIATGGKANESEGDSVNDKSVSIQALGLEDIGVDVDELSRDIGIVDSTETMALNREHAIPGFVRVTDGRGGLPKVTLTHPSGSCCDVYLHGANILSWVLANGGEVFYTPDGTDFTDLSAIEWGNPFCFPQFGVGGERAGSPLGENSIPVDGFVKGMKWSIVQTGLHEDKHGEFPYVTIEVFDTEATRAMWNHSFHLTMDISLEHTAINVSLNVKNTGSESFECAAALKSHVAVADIEEPTTSYIGLEDCVYLDNTLHPTKPRVRFTDETEDQEWLQLKGLTDRVYINTHNDTGVEVGTGCTVFLRDMSPLGVTGFSDRAVFNPWKENDKDNYRWYAGLAIGAIGKLIRIEPETKHTSEVRFEVVDMVRTQSIQKRKDVHEKHALRKMTERPKYDLLADELPSDLQ